MALAGRWREVLELELGRGACNGAVSNAYADAGGRGVAVVDRYVLTELDAEGAGFGYSGVVERKVGWVKGGGGGGRQRENKSKKVKQT